MPTRLLIHREYVSSNIGASLMRILLMLLTIIFIPGQAEAEVALKPLPRLAVDLGNKHCTILCPATAEYRALAAKLANAIQKSTGRLPAVKDDTVDPATLGQGPLLVLGNLTDGVAAKRLYLDGYDFTDLAWPGVGGYLVRTIRDPFGSGVNVVMLGGSDVAGVAAAAAKLADIVAKNGPRLGYRNEVKLGKNADAIRGWTDSLLDKNNPKWKEGHQGGGYGSWAFMSAIGQAAAGYLRTGDEAYLPAFKRELLYFFEHDVHKPNKEAKQMLHGFVRNVLLPWDLLRDHPFFSEEDRQRIDAEILFICRSPEGPRRIGGWVVRGNHDTMRALDGFFLGRYFQRRYRLKEAKKWMEWAEACFAPQMTSAKPIEDNYYHEYVFSLHNTVVYAMATGKTDYCKSDALRFAAERAIIANPVGSKVGGYLSACAVATNDPRYLSLEVGAGPDAYIRSCAAMKGRGSGGESLLAFCGFASPAVHSDLTGLAIAHVDPLWYKTNWINPGGIYKKVHPEKLCIDKISVRDGFDANDFYMLIDGIAGGNHAFEDANCLVRYREGGVTWLTLGQGLGRLTASTVRQQNGVAVTLDGQGPRSRHRFARLLYGVEKPNDGLNALGTSLDGLTDVDWQRHTIRKKDAWTLVIDRTIVKKSGELLVERHWHPRGKVTATNDGLVSVVKRNGAPVCFHLQSAGLPATSITVSSTENRGCFCRA